MKNIRKWMTLLGMTGLLAGLLTGCGQAQDSQEADAETVTVQAADEEEETYELEMAILTWGTTPADLDKVVDEVNKIAEEEVNVHVNITPISYGDYATQVNLILSGSEKMDLLPVLSTQFSGYVGRGQLLPIDAELAEYGQGIIEAIGEDYLKAGIVGGEQYGITTNRDLATNHGIVMRADLAEKYGVDYDKITSMEELEEALAAAKEDGYIPLVPSSEKVMWYNSIEGYDSLGDNLGVLMNYGETLDVVNLFETEEYSDFCHLMREWYQKGYILEDASTASDVGAALVKADRAFAYFTSGKPGFETQAAGLSGYDMKYVEIKEAFTSTSTVQVLQWALPKNCENTAKTMQFLNLMYTNADIQNLLAWGIEGEHYVLTEDGHITYPEGVNADNTGYGLNMGWEMGNQFLTYVWEGDDLDLWQEMDKFNKSAKVSSAMGYAWDSTNVSTEIAACSNVINQYRVSLECGMVDVDTVLPEFIEALKSAGIDKIIEEKQAQIDAWAAE